MAWCDPIHVAWLACNPGKPVPPELHVGPATVDDPPPDPKRAERNRVYQREYQKRHRRSERAPLVAAKAVPQAVQQRTEEARQGKLASNRKRRATPKVS